MHRELAPTILLGSQRSGTTALAYMLNQAFHSAGGMFSVNGKLMYYLNRWLQPEDLYHCHLRVDEILYSMKRRPPGGIGIEALLDRMESVLRQAAAEVAEGVHEDTAALAQKIVRECYSAYSRWGEKYNEYLLMFPELCRMVPDAKYIFMFRKPYDAALSLMDWTGDRPWKPSTIDANLTKWALWHTKFIESVKGLPTNRYIVVEYGRLCEGQETNKLSDFIGMDLHPYSKDMKQRRNTASHSPLPPQVQEVWNKLEEMACV